MILLMQQYIKVHQKSAIEFKKKGDGNELDDMHVGNRNQEVDIHRGGTNKDELLLDYLDKGIDTIMMIMVRNLINNQHLVRLVGILTVKDSNDNEDSEGNQCDNNSYVDALLDDDVRVTQIVVNSSDD